MYSKFRASEGTTVGRSLAENKGQRRSSIGAMLYDPYLNESKFETCGPIYIYAKASMVVGYANKVLELILRSISKITDFDDYLDKAHFTYRVLPNGFMDPSRRIS
ncbi:MAG: hypothetical protein LUQ38_02385 [Methanotrichaceae archaeon]|nr:hypothetical protein [Methanotrichaceae archaeon]MDD1758535.1 hypothetical protein [Methanotrichaceae archaeon]